MHQIELQMQNDELRRAHEELTASRERLSRMFHRAPVGYLVLDARGLICEANETFCRMTDYDAAVLKGRAFSELLVESDRAVFLARYKAFFKHPAGKEMEGDLLSARRDRIAVRMEGSSLNSSVAEAHAHEQPGLLLALSDITGRKVAERELRQSLQEKVALLKEVHHRVKNNLQIVDSLLGLQANRSSSPEVLAVLQDSRNRVRSMALLHESLYRSESLARINFAAYVDELCRQVVLSFGRAAEGLTVEKRVSPVRLALDQAVPCGLIINELVSNALKHGFPRGRPGRVLVELGPVGEAMLRLRVRDDGVGLPPEIDPASTPTLGLQLVSDLAGQLDGQLFVEAAEGGGATISVCFPLVAEICSGDAS